MITYGAITGRNIGFVTEDEQERLHNAVAFVCGTGGMGGAVVQSLARVGVGHLIIADIDGFEASNLNRQIFATLDTLGADKAEAAAAAVARINPHIRVGVLGHDWVKTLPETMARAQVVVNGTDDLAATLHLYRSARSAGLTVVDAYAAPLPSVYVTRPQDPDHETRLGYPTRGTVPEDLTEAQRAAAFRAEMEWVMLHSSSRHHIDLEVVADVVAGRRPRMSFAPMVLTAGQLMAYEAVNALLDRPHGADYRGWFFNPYRGRVEKPWPAPIAALIRPIIRRAMARNLVR